MTTEIKLYPSYNGRLAVVNHVAAAHIAMTPKEIDNPKLVVLLDNSGSMGIQVERIANTILPNAFLLLKYKPTDRVSLISFESSSVIYDMTVAKLRTFRIRAQGGTNMTPGIHNLASVLMDLFGNNSDETSREIRLLTVSDGEVYDVKQALQAAENLEKWSHDLRLSINSQAIRFLSSDYANPDTRALCSLLQLNNGASHATAIDVRSTLPDKLVEEAFANAFRNSESLKFFTLASTSSIFKVTPWQNDSVATSVIKIATGKNYFWIPESVRFDPSTLTVNGDSSDITVFEYPIESISWKGYELLLKEKIDVFINQIKVLKVLDTEDAKAKVSAIVQYFEGLERYVSAKQNLEDENNSADQILPNNGLAKRVSRMRATVEKKSKSILQTLLEIANDNKVGQLNSAQQAAYLRSMDVSKNSKSVAKRAIKSTSSLDFDSIARIEVAAMYRHLSELDDVDDSAHEKSFYSFDTTLGGIRTVCSLVEDGFINDMSCNQILELLNIVGIPCEHQIGDYPDAISFYVDKIHFGSFISLSDILVHQVQGGSQLLTPGTNFPIINAIPFFEDPRIAKFYKKYAPRLLEFTASIGMRRVIADIPMTFGYTILGGLWRLIELIKTNRTEQWAKILVGMAESAKICIGGYFNYMLPYFDPLSTSKNDGNIANLCSAGITGCLIPIMYFIKATAPQAERFQSQMLPRVLRALYSYEIWVCIRRMYRHQQNSDEIIDGILEKLLSIDIEATRTPLLPLFEPDPDLPNFNESYTVNESYLSELKKKFYFVDNIYLLGPVLSILTDESTTTFEKVKKLQSGVPDPSESNIATSMKIGYDYSSFQLYNIIAALVYKTKASRCEENGDNMLLPDVVNQNAGISMITDYIRGRHAQRYALDLKNKRDKENDFLTKDLVTLLVGTNDFSIFCNTLRDGLQKGDCLAQITHPGSNGFAELLNKVLNIDGSEVPVQLGKLWVILLGRKPGSKKMKDTGEIIWNNGNVLMFAELEKFERVFEVKCKKKVWVEALKEYKKRRCHVYRDGYNRHGHGNEKPSYWALGFESLDQMKQLARKEEYAAYVLIHKHCCGL
ncbi:hypothetical protein HK100_007498 [Physocladia obscura]|uniref:VWFA domain-containing protein n=1 Tax=Physocladia obscura TaxID=109957 RepID=A0AAD5T744_9FUNG|nr:hypothetical protein HK100_007498 [Physocladia obscura]